VTTARPPKTPFNGPVSAHRRFAFGSLSLDAVRQVRRQFGVTVTSAAGERKVTKWTMRSTKLPKRSDRCAPAGGRLTRC
jgi:hypothetical protein